MGTKVFWVQTGGYDTHAAQNPNQANGSYTGLMATLNDGLFAFYTDLLNQGLLGDTLVLQFSEFGRRINENGSQGTDHGAASVMMAMGGSVRGGIFGTAPNLRVTPDNPTLENSGNDVHYETDFRSVYAKVIDSWLGGDSRPCWAGTSGAERRRFFDPCKGCLVFSYCSRGPTPARSRSAASRLARAAGAIPQISL